MPRQNDVYQRENGAAVETLVLRSRLSERRSAQRGGAEWTGIVVRHGDGVGCNEIAIKVEDLATGGWRKLEEPARRAAPRPSLRDANIADGNYGGGFAVGGNGGASGMGAAGGATWTTWTTPATIENSPFIIYASGGS